jgi:hypothetical protein
MLFIEKFPVFYVTGRLFTHSLYGILSQTKPVHRATRWLHGARVRFFEADSLTRSEKIPRTLWNPKVHELSQQPSAGPCLEPRCSFYSEHSVQIQVSLQHTVSSAFYSECLLAFHPAPPPPTLKDHFYCLTDCNLFAVTLHIVTRVHHLYN